MQPHADRQSVLAQITLCIPWLAPSDQALVFNNISFERPEQQEEYVREWARKRTGLPCDFQIRFYPGRYAVEKCSILPVGDPTSYISDKEVSGRIWLSDVDLHAARHRQNLCLSLALGGQEGLSVDGLPDIGNPPYMSSRAVMVQCIPWQCAAGCILEDPACI